MGWGNKAIEIRAAETGHLDGVFMHKKAQKLKFLCERNDKVSILTLPMPHTHICICGSVKPSEPCTGICYVVTQLRDPCVRNNLIH